MSGHDEDWNEERVTRFDVMVRTIPAGVVHKLPKDLRALLLAHPDVLAAWIDLTPLARNEWICWIEVAKKEETRDRKLVRIREDLLAGKRRPCCWPGCRHRERNGR